MAFLRAAFLQPASTARAHIMRVARRARCRVARCRVVPAVRKASVRRCRGRGCGMRSVCSARADVLRARAVSGLHQIRNSTRSFRQCGNSVARIKVIIASGSGRHRSCARAHLWPSCSHMQRRDAPRRARAAASGAALRVCASVPRCAGRQSLRRVERREGKGGGGGGRQCALRGGTVAGTAGCRRRSHQIRNSTRYPFVNVETQ